MIENIFSTDPGPAFSAEIIDESIQTLADGNHIRTQQQGKMYRDSQGKIRIEHTMKEGDNERTFVLIFDAARRTSTHFEIGSGSSTRAPTAHTSHVDLPSREPLAQSTQASKSSNSRAFRFLTHDKSVDQLRPRYEPLADRIVEGFTVTGGRETRTIKAGEVGNELPIAIVCERWHSELLGQDLLIESDDPRYGHQTHKLINILLEEPDSALFQVPQRYEAEEQPVGRAQQAK